MFYIAQYLYRDNCKMIYSEKSIEKFKIISKKLQS